MKHSRIFTATVLCLVFGALLMTACDSGPEEAVWEDLGFPEQSAYVLFLEGGDLYVGAGHDGLWALDLEGPAAEWEYLGHRVTDGERHFESGVQAVDVFGERIIIRSEQKSDERGVGVWMSDDRGQTWVAYDDGMGTERYESFWPRDFARNPNEMDLILAGDGTIYRSQDAGESWYQVYPTLNSRYSSLFFRIVWHPGRTGEAWALGETNRFQPWLMRSIDWGATWTEYSHVNVPGGNAFFSMAFDAVDPDIIYVGGQGAVIRSTQGGAEWMGDDRVPALFTDPQGNFFYALQAHPRLPGILFASAGARLYASRNQGNTVHLLDTPEGLAFILDMWYDDASEALYVAGDGGVFRLRNPLGAIP